MPSDKAMREACKGWVIFNGEKYRCQWEKGHLGAHSVWVDNKKVKWPNLATLIDEKDAEIAELKAELKPLQDAGYVTMTVSEFNAAQRAKAEVKRLTRMAKDLTFDLTKEEDKTEELEAEVEKFKSALRESIKEHQEIIVALQAKLATAVEALREVEGCMTLDYDSQAKKYLKPEFRGNTRVWSDGSCWLHPGDSVYEIDKTTADKIKEALLSIEGQGGTDD